MTDAAQTIPEPIRAQAQATLRLARELHGEALSGPVVLQPSHVQRVAAAVSGGRALEQLARDAGQVHELALMVEAAHVLHYELSNRLRDAEDLGAGSDVVRLIDAMGAAAERLAP